MKPRVTLPWWLATACLVSSLTALPLPAGGQTTAEAYSTAPASADGIGKLYMGREISAVMGFQGAAWLEREEREKEERTDILIDALNLQPGMVVDDIGAGTARRMAGRVAPEGKVLAVNVQPEMLRMLERLAQQQGVGRIEPTLATERDVMLAAGSVDVAVMVDVHHELAYPMAVLASVVLAPGSRLIPRSTRLRIDSARAVQDTPVQPQNAA